MTIAVQNLSFAYDPSAPILKNLIFSVEPGQFIGIFGPNGGGKTTLLKLLLGLELPSQGSIKLLGLPPQEARSKIGYVPQVRRLDRQFPLSVFEVVLQGRLCHHKGWGNFSKDDREQALDALEKVGLKDKKDTPFGTLSGGQIQRMLIARALATQPEILLLDEATVGIDPEALSEILKFLLTLKGQMTILMVTHELQTIAKEMDKLYCIQQELTPYTPQEVCGHFAMGLYHPKKGRKDD